jgi:hypothetical protein
MIRRWEYESLADFYDAAKVGDYAAANRMTRRVGISKNASGETERFVTFAHFAGRSFYDALALRWGFPDGAAKIAELPEIQAAATGRSFRRVWAEDDGDDLSVERMDAGLPCLRKRVPQLGRTGPRCALVCVNVAELANVDWEKMLWKTYAVCRLVDDYERQGVRCEVDIYKYSTDSFRNYDDGLIRIRLKRADEPLNISLLAAATAPWFFRWWMFIHHNENNPDMRSGVGFAASIDGLVPEGAIVMNPRTCLSKWQAEAWLAKVGMRLDDKVEKAE